MIELELPYNDLEVKQIDGMRCYITPNGDAYPSVTTMLKNSASQKFLDDWRERIGEKKANHIQKESAKRGNAIHSMIESHLYGTQLDTSDIFHGYVEMYDSLKPLLSEISPVGLEIPIYSDLFKLAGRIDCIGYYKGKLSIIDFKTSGKPKKDQWITDYYLQATCYSYMMEELLGIRAKQIVVLVGVHDDDPQEFIRDRSEFKAKLKRRVNKFRRYLDS